MILRIDWSHSHVPCPLTHSTSPPTRERSRTPTRMTSQCPPYQYQFLHFSKFIISICSYPPFSTAGRGHKVLPIRARVPHQRCLHPPHACHGGSGPQRNLPEARAQAYCNIRHLVLKKKSSMQHTAPRPSRSCTRVMVSVGRGGGGNVHIWFSIRARARTHTHAHTNSHVASST